MSQNELLFAYLNLGKFFGEVDGPILNTLAFYKILRKIKIYDYQATCLEQIELSEPTFGSPANGLWTPFKMVTSIFNWIIGKYAIYVYCKFQTLLSLKGQIALTFMRLELHSLWNPEWSYAFPDHQNSDFPKDFKVVGDGPFTTQSKPCDKETYLYELDETLLDDGPIRGILRNCHDSDCERLDDRNVKLLQILSVNGYKEPLKAPFYGGRVKSVFNLFKY